jgi:hypothetical protein
MDEMIVLKLPKTDVGQILDALRIQRDNWQYTCDYLTTGEIDPDKDIQECSNPDEAHWLMEYYTAIIRKIEEQYK